MTIRPEINAFIFQVEFTTPLRVLYKVIDEVVFQPPPATRNKIRRHWMLAFVQKEPSPWIDLPPRVNDLVKMWGVEPLCTMALAHFGPIGGRTPPGSWSSAAVRAHQDFISTHFVAGAPNNAAVDTAERLRLLTTICNPWCRVACLHETLDSKDSS